MGNFICSRDASEPGYALLDGKKTPNTIPINRNYTMRK